MDLGVDAYRQLYDELTASENLRFYGLLYGVTEPAARAAFLLDRVGLAELAEWVARQEAEDRVVEARKELEMRGLVA